MHIGEDQFYELMFTENSLSIKQRKQFLINELKLKQYAYQSLAFSKQIKDYGFIKRYDIFCQYFPWVSSFKPSQIQCQLIIKYLKEVYDTYKKFLTKGWWKQDDHKINMQQYLIVYLNQQYSTLSGQRKRFMNTFDKFFLSFFYTLNVMKSTSRNIKTFCYFLNCCYSPSQFFLYICLRYTAISHKQHLSVDKQMIKKLIKVLQDRNTESISINSIASNFSSVSHKEQTQNQQNERVSLENIFQEPGPNFLVIPKVQMYKIMKICDMIQKQAINDYVSWQEFIKAYFNDMSCQQQSFQYLTSVSLAKATYQLSEKLIKNQQSRKQFLEKAFTYVFEILEVIFDQKQLDINDLKTKINIINLKKTYKTLKNLNNYGIVAINRLTKKILKNNYILSLYRQFKDYE